MLHDSRFGSQALSADSPEALLEVYERYLAFVESPPKPTQDSVPPELRKTNKLAGGLLNDIKRRAPFYFSDFSDGLHPKALASTLFLFFACLAPAIAFGGLLTVLTHGQVGVVEMLVTHTLCGIVYALFSGQPLTILGSTGPVIIFMGILYGVCEQAGLSYLPVLGWIGLWTMAFIFAFTIFEAGSLMRWFSRFTDETFAALISLIFIVEAGKDILRGFTDESRSYQGALSSLVLALGTYVIATQLSRFRRSPLLLHSVREFLADFGPAIAIFTMTFVAWSMRHIDLVYLSAPEHFGTSTGRAWFVDIFQTPYWARLAAALPALLFSVLVFLDQNITVRLVNAPQHKLKKGAAYHLDLLVVGVLIGICSLFGLPWMVAATVRSLNHVRSLAHVSSQGGQEHVVSVIETRLTGLSVHVMIGLCLFVLPSLRAIPMSVLFGLFLFMGINSTRGNQFFERIKLWVTDPNMYPPKHYTRRVPKAVVHTFTAIQALCLTMLWIIKASILGIIFPLFIGLLVPIRLLMTRFFDPTHLAFLDAEEVPDEEMYREFD
ncbi:MAG: HCO3- transporter [Myxococcales bacterium]|nr:MAG: HCO3- transporter [Myxococcales bacterium]